MTEPLSGGWGRQCPNCDHITYPPVTPAILVLVHDGENVLLVHKPDWGKRYSIIAGFVEPGESLEGCVQREVREEVNVEVSDIRYIGSQPWPFPHQLMVGFTARYVLGEIRPDQQELDRAAWFHYNALPELPPPLSLARQIITTWVASQQ
jgi:NAD+ diphosphatase